MVQHSCFSPGRPSALQRTAACCAVALDVGTQRLLEVCVSGRGTLQRQRPVGWRGHFDADRAVFAVAPAHAVALRPPASTIEAGLAQAPDIPTQGEPACVAAPRTSDPAQRSGVSTEVNPGLVRP